MSTFRSDPAWIEAHNRYVAEMRGDEGDVDAYARRIQAAVDLREIERAHTPGRGRGRVYESSSYVPPAEEASGPRRSPAGVRRCGASPASDRRRG